MANQMIEQIEKIRCYVQSHTVKGLFFYLFIAFTLIFMIASFMTKGHSFSSILFFIDNNSFMDFFNVIYIANNDPYAEGAIYPPLTYAAFIAIGRITGIPEYINDEYFKLGQNAGMAFVIFVMVALYLMYRGIVNLSEAGSREKELTAIVIMLSLPMLFTLERGNTIIYAAAFLLFFISGYKSDNKYVKYASLLCLAISINLKIYVAIFSLLLLKKESIKDFYWTIGFSLSLLIYFVFTGGNPLEYFSNLIHWGFGGAGADLTHCVGVVSWTTLLFDPIGNRMLTDVVTYLIIGLIGLSLLLVYSINKGMDAWKTTTIMGLLLIECIGTNGVYTLLFMIPGLLLFLNSDPKLSRINVAYAMLFVCLLIPFPNDLLSLSRTNFTSLLESVSLTAMSFLIVYEELFLFLKRKKECVEI